MHFVKECYIHTTLLVRRKLNNGLEIGNTICVRLILLIFKYCCYWMSVRKWESK